MSRQQLGLHTSYDTSGPPSCTGRLPQTPWHALYFVFSSSWDCLYQYTNVPGMIFVLASRVLAFFYGPFFLRLASPLMATSIHLVTTSLVSVIACQNSENQGQIQLL